MHASARETYLATQVQTATPQKLRLMLIEGAIRYGLQAQKLWEQDGQQAAQEALVRCHDIVGELLSDASSSESDLSGKLASVYLYLFRTLSDIRLQSDQTKLNDVLRVLAVEQQTWREVCEKFGAEIHESTKARSGEEVASGASST